MKKISICEDTALNIFASVIISMLIFLVGAIQYLNFTSGSVYGIILGGMLFVIQYGIIMIIFLALDKDEWVDRMNPFKLTGDCNT